MAPPAHSRRVATRRHYVWRAICVAGVLAAYAASVVNIRQSNAQSGEMIQFPKRPGATATGGGIGFPKSGAPGQSGEQMLVRANEINYDHTNDRVSAVGNVQIYYNGATLEADRVIYDQKTKRVHAEGNVKLTEPNGRVTYGEIINLSDDFRDGFVDSLRLDTPEQTRMAARARRPQRRQHHRAAKRRLHRVRSLRRRSQETAEVAGQSRPHHPRSGRADDLFRGCSPRILRRAAGLYSRTSRRPIRPRSARPAS